MVTIPSLLIFTDFAGKNDKARAVLIQPDGKIVVCGQAIGCDQTDFAVARYHPNGALDNSFDSGGKTTVDLGGYNVAHAIALQSDGKVVLAGTGNGELALLRLTEAGMPDTSFGPNHDGTAVVSFDDDSFPGAVVVQPDGKIIVGGSSKGDYFLQRLLVNGLPDSSFGSNGSGITITDMGDLDTLTALALASNSWLYVAGCASHSATSRPGEASHDHRHRLYWRRCRQADDPVYRAGPGRSPWRHPPP